MQHPASRRQELPLSAADHHGGLSTRAGGAPGRAGRELLCGSLPAREVRPPNHGVDAAPVRYPFVQRGHHRQARSAVPRVRHQTLYRALRGFALFGRPVSACCQADRALSERFEEAAQLRDAMRTVQTLDDRQQKMATAELGHRDVFGLKNGPAGAVVLVFQVRRGRVIERVELASESALAGGDDGAVLQAAIQQFYELRVAPPEVHVPAEPDDQEALEGWLGAQAGRKVRIVVPQRGDKRGLIELANRNARLGYQTRFNADAAAEYDALERLRVVLALETLPRRVECFDISTIQGSDTVASMVVCEEGRMRPGEYRKYRIRGLEGAAARETPVNNDFAAMHEVVRRRYRKVLEEGGPFPDLILIDGGKGQLSSAYAALHDLGLANLLAVGIAKKEELLYTRQLDDPIALPVHDPALLLLQRIRDEAHRFAVAYHRQSRARRDLGSDLDRIAGIGPRRRRVLLTRFGSLAGVRRATREELASEIGAKAADAVLAFFSSQT
ncbi:MAG: excinuclease ABC subunit C [Acidobacteria bacterium]|nr:MAG: excinuclease ABC subunit C [Acidobacteriota bacterium]